MQQLLNNIAAASTHLDDQITRHDQQILIMHRYSRFLFVLLGFQLVLVFAFAFFALVF